MTHQRGWNQSFAAPMEIPVHAGPVHPRAARTRVGNATLRTVVLSLVLLAVGKVGYREYLYRSSMSEVIGAAYRERAIQACQLEPRNASLGLKPSAWATASTERLAIGKPGLGVYIWQIDDASWNARYRNPYLIMRPSQRATQIWCEYDIVNGAATLYRL